MPAKRHKSIDLTPKEEAAIEALITAIQNLPSSICLEMDEDDGHLKIMKREAVGLGVLSSVGVSTITKRSLFL